MALKHQMCAYAAKSGLEEDEITWHSNQHSPQLVNRVGLAEDKIT